MARFSRFLPSPAIALGFAAFVLGATGLAFAAIPDSKGVIHSCYSKKKGTLRVVKDPKCKEKERALAWNQRGPQGKQGRQGKPGVPGQPVLAPSTSANNFVDRGSESGLTGTISPVIDLFTVNGGSQDLRIRTTSTANIIVTAEVTLMSPDATATADCGLEISDSTGPTNGLNAFTPTSESTIVGSVVVTLTGAAAKVPGTYNLRMVCREVSGQVVVGSASLTAIAGEAQPQ